jgi:RND family efflux transporter MFP subunit
MKHRNILFFILSVAFISIILILIFNFLLVKKENLITDSVTYKNVESKILANGTIASQNEATLHFQTGGKLTYLSAKEGDTVHSGQTIARLDAYALQRQVQLAANSYEVAKNSTEQTLENNQAGILSGQQRTTFDTTNKNSYSNVTEAQAITDAVKRIVDSSQLTESSAQLNVELANYALQLSSLTAPFDGTIIHEDVDNTGVNITPLTSFLIADPDALVFRAFVDEQDIDYVSPGSPAKISLNGSKKTYGGYVSKIYPEKTTLPGGQSVYKVDILSDLNGTFYSQAGSVEIKSNAPANTKLVPRWTVLNGQEIWVKDGNKIELKTVETGQIHGDFIEIVKGLSEGEKIITNPRAVVQNKYTVL